MFERNFSDYVVRRVAMPFKVDSHKLIARIAMLKDQLSIAKFVGHKPSPQYLGLWLQTLNHELRCGSLTVCRNVGRGHFLLASQEKDTLHHALMLSPFKSKWGACMLQS